MGVYIKRGVTKREMKLNTSSGKKIYFIRKENKRRGRKRYDIFIRYF